MVKWQRGAVLRPGLFSFSSTFGFAVVGYLSLSWRLLDERTTRNTRGFGDVNPKISDEVFNKVAGPKL